MNRTVLALCLLLASVGVAPAHVLDQYLQASLVSVEKDRVQVSVRLVPGIAVVREILPQIDANGDGAISAAEGRAYARHVLADTKLSLDGQKLTLQLLSVNVPAPAALFDGMGEIHIDFAAPLPRGGVHRRLVIESRHMPRISAYLVNSLVSSDPQIRLEAQRRNSDQSVYELDYSQAGGAPVTATVETSGFGEMFRLGLRHIAEGTDHLLFLLALLLPTPLLARSGRWAGPGEFRRSLLQIAGVVTAFTLGHSLTLALAGLGWVTVSSKPVEILIAVSILISAIHALRPLFPGREAWIAAFFGLVHGLAFASVLGLLGMSPWERAVDLLGFNLGIEAMQLIVVAATLPSLILFSRTGAYALLRIGGAVFAGFAACGWIAERVWGLQTPADAIVNAVAQQAGLLAMALFLVGLMCWLLRDSWPPAIARQLRS